MQPGCRSSSLLLLVWRLPSHRLRWSVRHCEAWNGCKAGGSPQLRGVGRRRLASRLTEALGSHRLLFSPCPRVSAPGADWRLVSRAVALLPSTRSRAGFITVCATFFYHVHHSHPSRRSDRLQCQRWRQPPPRSLAHHRALLLHRERLASLACLGAIALRDRFLGPAPGERRARGGSTLLVRDFGVADRSAGCHCRLYEPTRGEQLGLTAESADQLEAR